MSEETESSPVPGTVFTPRQVRILKVAVIVMGILLVTGFAAVLSTIVYQASKTKDTGASTAGAAHTIDLGRLESGALSLPSGMEVVGLALDGDRLALHLKGADGAEIAVVDLPSGKVVARLRVRQ